MFPRTFKNKIKISGFNRGKSGTFVFDERNEEFFEFFFYRFKGFETVSSIINKIFVFNIKAEYGLLSELKF